MKVKLNFNYTNNIPFENKYYVHDKGMAYNFA